MMYTDSTYKGRPCCGDTDALPRDYQDLCGKMRLYKQIPSTAPWDELKESYTELYWPWFLFGDDECQPSSSYTENEATFNVANGDCNPSEKIYNAKNES